MVTKTDIEAAASRVAGRVRTTPVLTVEPAAFGLPCPVTLKLELFQHTASFKPRGAFNRMLSAGIPEAGVVAASGGNHGLGVAYAARELGVPAEIFVPESTPSVKVARLRALGARVTVTGVYYAEAYEASQKRAAETGALVVHAYDQPEVVAGQGTLGRELLQQMPDVETVVVAVGGGGLLAGVATAVAGHARVVAAEPRPIPTLNRALTAGGPVDVPVSGVAADSLGARRIGDIAYQVAVDTGVHSVLVPDEAIRQARQLLWDQCRIVAEPGGACALAALVCGAYVPGPDEHVAVVVCGGNTDPSDLVGSARPGP